MNLEAKRQSLMELLMNVREESILNKVEEALTGKALIKSQMEERTRESELAIARGEVMSIEEVRKSGRQWLKENATK